MLWGVLRLSMVRGRMVEIEARRVRVVSVSMVLGKVIVSLLASTADSDFISEATIPAKVSWDVGKVAGAGGGKASCGGFADVLLLLGEGGGLLLWQVGRETEV